MNNLIVTIFINLTVLSVFVIFLLLYFNKILSTNENLIETSQLESNTQTLDDFFYELEVIQIRKKIASLKSLKSIKTPIQTQMQGPLSIRKEEQFIIRDGEDLLKNYDKELYDDIPKSKYELDRDKKNLLNTISELELLDPSYYNTEIEDVQDMGKGMFYDTTSRKLNKIIRKNGFNKLAFIQAEKLENIAFDEIKHLEHRDFHHILGIMKDIGNINQIIEIGPFINLITFQKNLKLNVAEKVIISLYINNNLHNYNQIQEKTIWKPSFLNKVLKNLQAKNIVEIEDQEIIIKGLINQTEQEERLRKLDEKIQTKIEKEKDGKKLQSYRLQQLISINRKKSRVQQEKLLSQQSELLAEAKIKAEKEAKVRREKAERLTIIEDEERKKKIKKKVSKLAKKDNIEGLEDVINKMEKIKTQSTTVKTQDYEIPKLDKPIEFSEIPHDTENLEDFFADINLDEIVEEHDENQMMIDDIINLFNDIGKITGGIVTFSTLLTILKNGPHPNLKRAELLEVVDILKIRKIILEEISFPSVKIYIFEDLVINDDMRKLLKEFIVNEDMDEEDIEISLNWKNKRIKEVIKRFEKQNLIKQDEKKHYYLPGLINAKKKK